MGTNFLALAPPRKTQIQFKSKPLDNPGNMLVNLIALLEQLNAKVNALKLSQNMNLEVSEPWDSDGGTKYVSSTILTPNESKTPPMGQTVRNLLHAAFD